jgi:hypothetical protein
MRKFGLLFGNGLFALPALALLGGLALMSSKANAITYGAQDCEDNATNLNCGHPNVVSLSGFRPATPDDNTTADLVSFVRCTGSLLRKDEDKFVILTAGHCASAWLAGLQDGSILDVGVSFDALINRDVSPELGRWSPAQFILGGQPVLSPDYGFQGNNKSIPHYDYAIVVFEIPPGGLVTDGGESVDISTLDVVNIPPVDYLVGKVGGRKRPTLTEVGYGVGEHHNAPGTGGNAGGSTEDLSKLGVRWVADHTQAFHFKGPERNLLGGAQNPARGFNGTCSGDSGGPVFYEEINGLESTEIQVGITSSGDAQCVSMANSARTDAARAHAFIACTLEGETADDIGDCGCLAVDSKELCAKNNSK